MAYDTISMGQCPLCGRSGSIALTWAHSWDRPLRGEGWILCPLSHSLWPGTGTLHHRNTRQGDHLKVSYIGEEAIPPHSSSTPHREGVSYSSCSDRHHHSHTQTLQPPTGETICRYL